jgi:hypothetical protein
LTNSERFVQSDTCQDCKRFTTTVKQSACVYRAKLEFVTH